VHLLFTVLSDMIEVMVALAENLRKFRKRAKISQKQLADRIGISCPRISEIESGNGNPTVKTLEKIATALQVEPMDLLRKPKPKK
jgi:transcriptional regulator with XRE-family HTH domain